MSLYMGMAISYLIGMFTAMCTNTSFFGFTFLAILIINGLLFIIKRRNSRDLILSFLLLAGFINMNLHIYRPDKISHLTNRVTDITGVVSSVVTENESYSSYLLKCADIGGRKYNSSIYVTSKFVPDTGSRVCVRGILENFDSPDNSTESDLSMIYKSKGINYKIYAIETNTISEKCFLFDPYFISEYYKSRIKTSIDRYFTSNKAALLKSVLLGLKSEFTPEFKKSLAKTSALRFLHPSFLHMFLLLSFIELLCVYSYKKRKQNITIAFIIIYAIFNSTFYTFIRTAIFYCLVILYKKIRGFYHYPDIICITILIIFGVNPLFIYNSGFVLSIFMTILFYNFLMPFMNRLTPSKYQSLKITVASWIIGTLGSLPLVAFFFGGVSLYTIILTFIYTPLTLLVFLLSPIVLLLYEILGKSLFLSVFLDGALELMVQVVKIIELLPGHHIFLPKPTAFSFLLFAIIFYLIKLLFENRTYEKKFIIFLTTLSLLTAVSVFKSIKDIGNMYVYFVNVGQGDASIINIKGKEVILVDGGGNNDTDSSYNIGEEVFLPYLTSKGFTKIDLAIVSHFHKDHCQGIIAAIENLDVKALLITDTLPKNELKSQLIKAANENGTKLFYAKADDRVVFDSGMTIDILHPSFPANPKDENDTSMAIKVNYKEHSLFFGGDISKKVEEKILSKLRGTDILKISHHGSLSSSSPLFIKTISPEYAVISVGENNSYSHPHPDVLKTLKNSGAKIFRTDMNGDIKFSLYKNGKVRVDPFKEE